MLESFEWIRSSTVIPVGVTVAKHREVVFPGSPSLEGVPARRKLALGPQVVTAEVERSLFLDLSPITAHSFGRLLYSPSDGILAVRRLLNRISTFRAVEQDLADVRNEAAAEGWPAPSEIACSAARRVLVEMFDILPCRYEVYPTSHGEIAIDLPSGFSASILVVCTPEGRAMYFVTAEGEDRVQENLPIDDFPDQFLRQQLVRLIAENRHHS